MKAMVYTEYGPPDVLGLQEMEKPAPGEDEVLVMVLASSINSWDWDLLRGWPPIARLAGGGLFKPKKKIIGIDIAGKVEAVGAKVTRFKPGDEVFGDLCESGWGGFAQYVYTKEGALALKSPEMTFEEAAAIPQAGVLALMGLRQGKLQEGQKVLINGAGGAVGTFAVQMAKAKGAQVTGVDKAGKLDMLRSIGADQVLDYTQDDFTKNGQAYDLILDVGGYRTLSDYNRALAPGGICILVGGPMPRLLKIVLLRKLFLRDRKIELLMHRPNEDLERLNELFEAGKVKPVIDRCYPLSELAEAFRYFGTGEFHGKVVITMEH